MKFLLNMSMLNKDNTGLGVYSSHCAEHIEKFFSCSIVSSNYVSKYCSAIISSPSSITFANSRLASLKRIFYLKYRFPDADFIYTPTHHGIFGHNNQVITIHDLISIHHPKQHKFQYFYFKYILPRLIQKCRAIFTVSQTAKQDICEYYHIKPEMVYVIPNGVDIKQFYPKQETCVPKQNYLLVVGAAYQHKNIHELILNCDCWKTKYKLKIVSARGEYAHQLKMLIKKYKLENCVEFCGFVNQEELVELYQNCKALIFPSLWEGFGIPPLETLACGRPVIISDIPVHREIIGEAGIYVTLGNESSWHNAFLQLEDENVVSKKVQLGQRNLKKYTWSKSCNELIKTLLKVEPSLQYCLKDLEKIGD